jgi:hypothetical protein
MGKKQSKPLESRPPTPALGRIREEVLRLRREVELEEARADAIAAQQHDHLNDAE